MQDESSTPQEEEPGLRIGRQEEEEVEGHVRSPEEPGARIGRQDDDDDEVEGHIRPRHSPEEPGRHF
ncbi:MAG TPA: hypothetical protein VGF70_13150 [Solirubrobacteraceae bacterium]